MDYNLFRSEIGATGYLNGEYGWELADRKEYSMFIDGDFTEEELENGYDLDMAHVYLFRHEYDYDDDEGYFKVAEVWNLKIYRGDIYYYDFPDLDEFYKERPTSEEIAEIIERRYKDIYNIEEI